MIWTISDLHLSFAQPKPMDIFGPRWRNHPERVATHWHRLVKPDDIVLVAGDISWAMHLNDALVDLRWIDQLPGTKYCIKGNHDYWWDRARPIRPQMPPSIKLIEADAVDIGSVVVCGSRGWVAPDMPGFDPKTDQRIYDRELLRMERGLQDARKLSTTKPVICMIHFPPFIDKKPTEFVRLFEKYQITSCLYGHLHRPDDWHNATQGSVNGIIYQLSACDAIDFTPIPVLGV